MKQRGVEKFKYLISAAGYFMTDLVLNQRAKTIKTPPNIPTYNLKT